MTVSKRRVRGDVLAAPLVAFLAGCQCGGVPCKTAAQGAGVYEEVCIPGGDFMMGHAPLPSPGDRLPDGGPVLWGDRPSNDWAPEHRVNLSPYFIDKYEVSWGPYRECVDAGVCPYHFSGGINGWGADPANANRPVGGATYDAATTYCRWKGRRLPTEAEWERAARGLKQTDFPWGNSPPSAELMARQVVYAVATSLPAEVGTSSEDVSPDGVRDLWGSVPEWVYDWYGFDYYQVSPTDNPHGPANSSSSNPLRVLRGDIATLGLGIYWTAVVPPVWAREKDAPTADNNFFGFRCARDDQPRNTPPASGIWPYQSAKWHLLPAATR